MNNVLQSQVIETALDEIGGLLREHMQTIDKSMQSAMAEADGEKTFKYPVSIGLVIEPHGGDQAKVTAKISYSVRHSDESIGQMVDPNQMRIDFPTPETVNE